MNHSYKMEIPLPYSAADSEKNMSKFTDTLLAHADRIANIYVPLGHVNDNVDFWGIRAPTFTRTADGNFNKEAVLLWENALLTVPSFLNIPFKILMNNSYVPNLSKRDVTAIKKKLEYYASHARIQSVCVNDVSLVDFIKDVGLPISLSTNSHDSFAGLDAIFTQFGIDTFESIVLARDLNRGKNKLFKYVHERGIQDRVVLMVNEGCVMSCPYKSAGDAEISLSDTRGNLHRTHVYGCSRLADRSPWLFLTSPFMTHEMLRLHAPWVRRVKLAGRDKHVGLVKKMVEHWATGADHELHKIMNVSLPNTTIKPSQLSETYMQDVMTCNKECFTCEKCKKHHETLVPPALHNMVASEHPALTIRKMPS